MTARCLAGNAPTARHSSCASSCRAINVNWSSELGRRASATSVGSSSRLCAPRLRAARATSRLLSIVARSSHALRCSAEANSAPLRVMRRTSATNTSWKTSSASARLRVCASARRHTAPPCSCTMRSNASPPLPPPTSRLCGGAPPVLVCMRHSSFYTGIDFRHPGRLRPRPPSLIGQSPLYTPALRVCHALSRRAICLQEMSDFRASRISGHCSQPI